MKLHDPDALRQVGRDLAQGLKAGDVLALSGPLGAGKTTLVQGIAQGLGIEEAVDSPTFVLIQSYHGPQLDLHHMDMYRIEDPAQAFDLGLDEYFEGKGVTIVEWPEQIEDLLPPWTQWWELAYNGQGRSLRRRTEEGQG